MATNFNPSLGTQSENGTGPLAKLNGSGFERTTLRYPIDLGSADKGHYVVFYARVQKDTQFPFTPGAETGFQDTASPINYSNGLGGIFSNQTAALGGASINAPLNVITKKGLPTRTVLTTDAIALYMPDTIQYQQQQSYETLKPGTELLGQLIAGGKSVADEYKAGGQGAIKNAAMKNAILIGGYNIANKAGAVGDLAFNAVTGTVVNPILEMIYRSPNFRTFQFDFMFYPKSSKEAAEVQNIIERLRFHQSPELLKGAEGFLIPPSEFDIIFYYAGKQNPNIPPLATCVLTDIQINYAPNGWSAFEEVGSRSPSLGGTGMPTAIQLTLQFQETTYLTKDDYRSTVGLQTVSPP